jgi:beta-lactamase class A
MHSTRLWPASIFAALAALAATTTVCPLASAAAHTAKLAQVAMHQQQDDLQSHLTAFARRAMPAKLGIAVLDLSSGKTWAINADVPFIMMSVFKAPVAAAVLSQVEAGKLSLDQAVTLAPGDLVEGSAVPSVGEQLEAGRTRFTVRELLLGAVSQSDNTAADALVKLLGGPHTVTAFLQRKGILGMHVETDERDIGRVSNHLRPGETISAKETGAQRSKRENLGYADMLADTRNRATPSAAVDFLRKLAATELLNPASTELLIDLMRKQTVPSRLRRGIPAGADFADKTGSSMTVGGRNAAWNDIGFMTLPDGRRIFVAVFLADTLMPKPKRDALFADIARAAAAGVPKLSAPATP